MKIRQQLESDAAELQALLGQIFGSDAEARLSARLWAETSPCVSLLAEDDEQIVGHILFSPVKLSADEGFPALALGPMAVCPKRQKQGIGSSLVKAGLEACRELGCRAVFVLGHADYYPRFGFLPASKFGIGSIYDVPDEVFMALELEAGALTGCAGAMRYHPAFNDL